MDTNRLAEKLTNLVTELIGALFFLLCCSAAAATNPFFRKNMGERYLTPIRIFLGFMGWFFMFSIAVDYGYHSYDHLPLHLLIPGSLIPLAYLAMSRFNLMAIHRRQTLGILWHSKTKGESIFGTENDTRDAIIGLAVAVALCFVSLFHAGFFVASRVMGYLADAAAWAALYNRYLDIQDGRIEAEFMQSALSEGFPARKTGGFYRPIPGRIKGATRSNVARVIAGGQGIAQPAPGSAPNVQSEASQAESAFPDSMDIGCRIVRSTLKSRWFRYAVVVLMIAGSVERWGVPLYHRWRANVAASKALAASQSDAHRVTVSNNAYRSPVTTPLPKAESSPKTNDAAAIAQAAAEVERKQEQERAAALAEQKRQEAERQAALELQRQQEKQKAFEQITGTLTNQVALLASFKADCEKRLDDNTHKIAKLSRSYRKTFTQQNDSTRTNILAVLQTQEEILNHDQEVLPTISANPKSDPQRISDQVTTSIAELDGARRQITAMLDSLDSDITNASQKKGFLFFK